MMASSSLPSSSKPKPPQHIRFSTEIAREMRPDTDSYTFSAADISATSSSDDSDVKSSLLPQPVGYKPRRRSYAPGVSTKLGENRGNIGLVVALLMLGMLFGTIIWENEGSESAFLSGTSTTAVSLVKRVLVWVDVFVMDQTSTLQHGAIKMGQFFHVLCWCFLYLSGQIFVFLGRRRYDGLANVQQRSLITTTPTLWPRGEMAWSVRMSMFAAK